MADAYKIKNPWNIRKEDFPGHGSMEEKIRFILGYAILAPSTHNSQPWLFKIENNSCRIYYDKKLLLPEADPKQRDLYISIGCMMENLIMAGSYFGIFKEFRYILEDNFIAEVFFEETGRGNTDLEYLVDTIPERVNARGVFEQRPVAEGIQAQMLSLNKNGNIKIDFVTGKEKINKLALLTVEGLKFAYRRTSFRKEMYRWIHSSISADRQGMPGYSLRIPFILSFIIPTLVRFFNISPLLAKLNYKSISSAPLICVLSSKESTPLMWLETGRLAERFMLQLNSQNVRTSIFVASIEMGNLYEKVQETIALNLTPQFLFCAGYMKHVQEHSPRHPLYKKII